MELIAFVVTYAAVSDALGFSPLWIVLAAAILGPLIVHVGDR